MNKIITIKNVNYYYNDRRIINNVSLNILKDQLTIFRGPNGAGKTTLLKLLYGLIKPTSGNIFKYYDENKCTCIIFQNPTFLNRDVYANLEHALYCKNIPKSRRGSMINNLLTKYSLVHISKKHIRHLSGGELQLVSLLRALVIKPDIIFYDEPTNNLDSYNSELVLDIIRCSISEKKQMILVSHDTNFFNKLNCKNIYLKDGAICDE